MHSGEHRRRQLRFATVDVFTDRQFCGNPLAVVLDADGLSTEQMQAIAAEFNLAETAFVLAPASTAHTARVRIFTPRAEMPFAGHPNIGTAFVLAREAELAGRPVEDEALRFEEIAGLVTIELTKDEHVVGARLRAPAPLSRDEEIPVETVAEACAIPADAIETVNHPPVIAGCGAAFVIAELKHRAALASARPRAEAFSRHVPRDRAAGVYLYAQTPAADVDIQSRMFAPLHGIAEDPATGSAAVALAGLLAQLAPERDLRLSTTIGQGFDMGRPSILEAAAIKTDGSVTDTFVGGTCVPVMRGVLEMAKLRP